MCDGLASATSAVLHRATFDMDAEVFGVPPTILHVRGIRTSLDRLAEEPILPMVDFPASRKARAPRRGPPPPRGPRVPLSTTTKSETIRAWAARSFCRPPTSTGPDRSYAGNASAGSSASTTARRSERHDRVFVHYGEPRAQPSSCSSTSTNSFRSSSGHNAVSPFTLIEMSGRPASAGVPGGRAWRARTLRDSAGPCA